MTDYKAIAANLSLPQKALIDGVFVDATSGKTFDTINPANGHVLTKVPACGPNDVDAAVASAKAAHEAGVWSRLHPSDRKAILCKFADLIDANTIELAVMESLDAGKPITDCVEIGRAS